MTLAELREMRDVWGWSHERIAADVFAGRDGKTIGAYLACASEAELPLGVQRWLPRARIELVDGEVHVIVTPRVPALRGYPSQRRARDGA